MLKKKLISALSAAAVAVSMTTAAVSTAFAKDTGISGDYTQGTTIKTFLDTDLEGYESITLNYEYNSLVDIPTETFGLLSFDSEWGGWDKTSVGQAEPVIGEVYSSTVSFDTLESSINTGKELYGFNLIADNFGEGSVKLNSVVLNEKQGKETLITGSWHKGTASNMTVSGDTDVKVNANEYNIYFSGFSTKGFTNPTVDVTVTYDNDLGDDLYKEATLYYVENFQQENEKFTPVEEYSYKKAEAGQTVTYSYSIDSDAHKLAACFDACEVTEIKIYDKTPEESVIKGNWTKGTASELTLETGNQDYWFSGDEDSIYVFNFSLKGYRSPTVEVTAQYDTIPADNSYMQAELYSKEQKIGGAYIPVTLGTHKYTFDVSDSLTEFNVCFDGCTVKEIKIYDNRSDIPEEVSGNTASELALKMGKAWNLGNALDSTTNGVADETLWNNKFPVSKPMFDTVKASGFDTVRIPVSYMDKIVYENGKYTVDDTYMSRVKQVVDVAIASGLYVVIDVHNDGGANVDGMWLDITKTETEFNNIKNKFSDLWTDIAVNFADYDQKLIFEGFNELNNGSYTIAPTTEQLSNVNTLNNSFVTAVRNAGGKNTDRVLIVAGYNTNIDYTVSGFAKPNDTASDRLMLSVHYYEPSEFTLGDSIDDDTWGTRSEKIYMQNQFKKLADFAELESIDMPVIVGEYGANDKGNLSDRKTYLQCLNSCANQYKMVTGYWDNGYIGEFGFALFDRTNNLVTSEGNALISAIKDITN